MKKNNNLGKRIWTTQTGNSFWIKKFENGIKLRKRGEGEITLDLWEVFHTLTFLRKFGKEHKRPILLDVLDMTYVWQKFPETKEFVEKLLMDEVTDKEKIKIHKEYMNKVNILEELEDK